jgi:hypothetical protein
MAESTTYIKLSELPPDFQQLLQDFIEELCGVEWQKSFEAVAIPVTNIPAASYIKRAQSQTQSKYDARDNRYQQELTQYIRAGGVVPPIVTRKGECVDGRHRLLALHELGHRRVDRISLGRYAKTLQNSLKQ